MDIRDFVDLNQLQRIQDQFSDATGLAAIAVAADGKYITEGSNFTDFCMKYTRGCTEGARRCVKCDNECKGTYFCHAGLMDFSNDIMVGDERVGSIIGGQVLPKPPDLDQFRAIARELGIPEDEYLAALSKVPIRSEKMIRASADMLGNIINQLVNLEYYKKLNAKKIDVFDTEIRSTIGSVSRMNVMIRDLQRVATMENILALNASVEAARAGQAGVGFAVLAREIGELSKSAAITYSELSDLIASVETSVGRMEHVKM